LEGLGVGLLPLLLVPLAVVLLVLVPVQNRL